MKFECKLYMWIKSDSKSCCNLNFSRRSCCIAWPSTSSASVDFTFYTIVLTLFFLCEREMQFRKSKSIREESKSGENALHTYYVLQKPTHKICALNLTCIRINKCDDRVYLTSTRRRVTFVDLSHAAWVHMHLWKTIHLTIDIDFSQCILSFDESKWSKMQCGIVSSGNFFRV